MELILWRHAEAEEGGLDSMRKLTHKGLKQAQTMAKWLKQRLPDETVVMASPTMRTQQTAAALKDDFQTIEEIGPGATAKAVLAAAGWSQGEGTVLIVGHQPTLGQAAALIISGTSAPWIIRKGSIWWFLQKEKRGDRGEVVGREIVLKAAISPEMI
ncbi:MAG TPA: histidine phosphatase family protein [Nitrosospira sp.]|nr:histidine phosphatase family protein [Nitrosospira sp.]